jgi:hypothetical protein
MARTMARTASLALTLTAVAACVAAGGITARPDLSPSSSPPIAASATPAGATAPSPSNCGGVDLAAATMNPYTIASLVRDGHVFLVGRVTAIEPAIFGRPFMVGSHGPLERVFTPVDVQIETALPGGTKPGPARLMFEGGSVGCYVEHNNMAPNLGEGRRYVFVTQNLADDGVAPTDRQGIEFAWEIDAGDIVGTPFGPMTLPSIANAVAAAASPTA